MSTPHIKGWCPGAHRPMMSGDGLVLRVRPRHSRVSRDQMLALCDLALRYGQGNLQLTNRANLQIRGVLERDHQVILSALEQNALLDTDPDLEMRRNIIVAGDSAPGDASEEISDRLIASLPELPELPAKFGFVIDCGGIRRLANAPGDIRVELASTGLVVRADGAPLGVACKDADHVITAIKTLVNWFVSSRTPHRRMATTLRETTLPDAFAVTGPAAKAEPLTVGDKVAGVAFGTLKASKVLSWLHKSSITGFRLTPDRLIRFEGDAQPLPDWLLTRSGDPLLVTHACVGRAGCPQATVETEELARQLAGRVPMPLHVSGCSKGCAHPRTAATTLVGNDGQFDLVEDGAPWDAPVQLGLTPKEAHELNVTT